MKKAKPFFIPISLFFLTIILRVIPAWKAPLRGDLPNYLIVGKAVLEGKNPYAATNVYSYPPIWMWFEALATWFSVKLNLPFAFIIKIPLLLSDGAIAVLLYKLGRKFKKRKSYYLGFFYALSPVSILITSFHGQFDTLPILAILLAIYFSKNSKNWLSPLLLSLGVALKGFPVLTLPFFLLHLENRRERKLFAFLTIAPVLLILLPFIYLDFPSVIRRLFAYSGSPDYGWTAIIRTIHWLKEQNIFITTPGLKILVQLSKIFFLACYGLLVKTAFIRLKKINLSVLIATTFGLFYFLYGGVASQYLLWVLPFLILIDLKSALIYSGFASLALLGYYFMFLPRLVYWAFSFFLPLSFQEKNIVTTLVSSNITNQELIGNLVNYPLIIKALSVYLATTVLFCVFMGIFLVKNILPRCLVRDEEIF